jgi:hypothetical protein
MTVSPFQRYQGTGQLVMKARGLFRQEAWSYNRYSVPGYRVFVLKSTSLHPITQQELNDFVRDLNLAQTQSELLASRLQRWNLLGKGVYVTSITRRQREFETILLSSEDVYCNDADVLFGASGYVHNPEEWRFCIDSYLKSV